MGQKSQIYVRFDKELVVANYYRWNYGERMISRARYGIEYIKDCLLEYKNWIFNDKNYMDTWPDFCVVFEPYTDLEEAEKILS